MKDRPLRRSMEQRLERLQSRRERILEAIRDCDEKIRRDGPPNGMHWTCNTREYLQRWRECCDAALKQVHQEFESLRISIELH